MSRIIKPVTDYLCKELTPGDVVYAMIAGEPNGPYMFVGINRHAFTVQMWPLTSYTWERLSKGERPHCSYIYGTQLSYRLIKVSPDDYSGIKLRDDNNSSKTLADIMPSIITLADVPKLRREYLARLEWSKNVLIAIDEPLLSSEF